MAEDGASYLDNESNDVGASFVKNESTFRFVDDTKVRVSACR